VPLFVTWQEATLYRALPENGNGFESGLAIVGVHYF
jgi:hypothetical protein